jgi:DNA-binding Lrp family transcriptional regulator
MSRWTLFSNHGHVLVCLAKEPESRLRDVADAVGITERAVQKIVRDLQDEGIIVVTKHGRCNHYRVNSRKPLRHPLEGHCTVGQLVAMVKIPKRQTAVKSTVASVVKPPLASAEEVVPAPDESGETATAEPEAQPRPESPSRMDAHHLVWMLTRI